MTRTDAAHAAWLAALLAAVAFVGIALPAVSERGRGGSGSPPTAAGIATAGADRAEVGELPEGSGARDGLQPRAAGEPALTDDSGHAIPLRRYRRVASASPLADRLLLELAEPERIVALSETGRAQDPERHRYGARPSVPADLERLLALRPDLLLVTHLAGEAEHSRIAAAGIEVFDLGEMHGLRTLRRNILDIASLLGDRDRGKRLFARFARRMRAVAADVPAAARKPGMYLAIYAGKLYGGTRGTSYHDVLTAAGLQDVAADRFHGWPQYDPEQVLALDPSVVVTNIGMRAQLCGNAWLRKLRACAAASGEVIELDGGLIGDPGLRMLDAAEALRAKLYPRAR